MTTKLSRRKAIYLILIIALSLMLLVQRIGGGSTVPALPVFDGEVVSLVIEGPRETLNLRTDGGEWLIGEERFPADSGKVITLIKKITDLRLLERVGSSGYLEPYQLSDGEVLRVTITTAGDLARTVLLGKASPTGRQTYVRFPDKNEVLLAAGTLRRDFEVEIDDLRNKEILTVRADTIRRLVVTVPPAPGLELYREGDTWATPTEETPDTEKVEAYLRNLTTLIASGFPRDAVDTGELLLHIELETEEGDQFVEIIGESPDGEYLARSSETPYIFTVAGFKGEQLIESPAALIASDDQ